MPMVCLMYILAPIFPRTFWREVMCGMLSRSCSRSSLRLLKCTPCPVPNGRQGQWPHPQRERRTRTGRQRASSPTAPPPVMASRLQHPLETETLLGSSPASWAKVSYNDAHYSYKQYITLISKLERVGGLFMGPLIVLFNL